MGCSADTREQKVQQLETALRNSNFSALAKLAASDLYSDGHILNKAISLGTINCLTFLLDKCSKKCCSLL